MPQNNTHEKQFLDALRDVFVGAKVEGESGYINLMKIKSRYYSEGVFPQLSKDIDEACKPFEIGFREELFDKLYDFFSRYFSESGSIYFRHTAPHHNVYERVYTNDRDVMLFWKTHMLYYVKTDRLFNSLEVEVDGVRFFFDVSGLKHKQSNEKRDPVYTFAKREQDGRLVFSVAYSEKGTKTKLDEVLGAIKQAAGAPLDEDTLQKAFRVFEKQSEVDYFINKNARAFLQEQFDLWMYQYLFKGESAFNEVRLKQLQALRDIAFKIIDFIAQFEDELVKVWNKPKFVRNSHYIITLDKIIDRDENLLASLFAHAGMKAQMAEWRELGMLDDDAPSSPAELLAWIEVNNPDGTPLHPQLRFLPLDTCYMADHELDILALFDDLDVSLDGRLIHSENYQALKTLLPKYQYSIKCVHIDPPYNTGSKGFLYVNEYQHASWLTMMNNRIEVGNSFLDSEGSFLVHVDENEYDHLSAMLRAKDYAHHSVLIWDKKNPMMGSTGIAIQHEYILWCSNSDGTFTTNSENAVEILAKAEELVTKHEGVNETSRKEFAKWVKNKDKFTGGEKAYQFIDDDGRVFQSVGLGWPNPNPAPAQFFVPLIHPITMKECPVPPRGWSRSPEKMKELLDRNEIIFGADETIQPRRKLYLTPETKKTISSVIANGQKGKVELDHMGLAFNYCHPTTLYKELFTGSFMGELTGCVLDFFGGSGTTAHTIMNLNRADKGNRKYILVEMGEHFNTVILPRVKKVAYSDKWKKGKADGGQGMSHFAKYYELEQYEDTLRRARYEDGKAPLFAAGSDAYTSYVFMRDLKMLDAIDIDTANNKIDVHLEKLYDGIDLAETLSCIKGKWIKRITKDIVEFQDGTTSSLSAPDWNDIKPLIWW